MSKIFCIGSNKTGTTSLTKVLKILGYSVCPEEIVFYPFSKYFYDHQKGNFDSLFELVEKYDSFEDRPWNHIDFYKILDVKYPDSKFILTIRNTENWINSYRRWSDKIKLRDMWFYTLVSQVCYGNNDFLSDEDNMRKKYEERNQEIIDYFKESDKLLILDFENESDWKPICNFLNKPIPSSEFPHLNTTK